MPQIDWDDSLCLGVEEIDAQHRELVRITNALLALIKAGAGEAEVKVIVKALREYTIQHFTDEEAFMRRVDYPDLDAHAEEHTKLTAQVKDYLARFYHHETVDPVEVRDLLKEWLLGHILQSDRAIGRHVGKLPEQPTG